MTDVLITGTTTIAFTLTASSYMLDYLWCSTELIQSWLSKRSMINIADVDSNDYPTNDAKRIENACVRKIVQYLNIFFIITTDVYSDYLIDLASELTAGTIGSVEMGASVGQEPADWTNRFKNEVWGALQTHAISNVLEDFTSRNLSLAQRLIYSKIRESTVVRNV